MSGVSQQKVKRDEDGMRKGFVLLGKHESTVASVAD